MKLQSRVRLGLCFFLAAIGIQLANAQCYTFTSTNDPAVTLSVTLTNLPAPLVYSDGAGGTVYEYDLYSVTGNSATLNFGGTPSTGSLSGTSILVINTGPQGTIFGLSADSEAQPNPFLVSAKLSADADPNLPNGLLPNGLPTVLPPLSAWTDTANNLIAGLEYTTTSPGVLSFNGPISSIGSGCGGPAPPAPTVEMLDPVPDLLDGAVVTTDTDALDDKGRAVVGVSADGIAQLVLRVAVQSPGDMVTATLYNDDDEQSSSSDEDGGFAALGTTVKPSDQLPSTATATADANGNAFFVYRAPFDFVRSSQKGADADDASRSVSIEFTYTSGGQDSPSQDVTVQIVRPPVVLIHGYAADFHSWDNFLTFIDDSIFSLYTVDYGESVPISGTNPPLPGPNDNSISAIRESDLGFSVSTPIVATEVEESIQDFKLKDKDDPDKLLVAAVKADVVAHSMGGLVARYWTTGKVKSYITKETYNSGYIHSLITIGTPHYGSPIARLYLEDNSHDNASCTRYLGYIAKRYSFEEALFSDGTSKPGAVKELEGDGTGDYLSDPLTEIDTLSLNIPTVRLAGLVKDHTISGATVIHLVCQLAHEIRPDLFPERDPLASLFTPSLFDYIFDPILTPNNPYAGDGPRSSDGAVPITSALLDDTTSTCSLPNCFSGAAHGDGTALLVGVLTNLLDDSEVADRVQDILNTPLSDSTIWSPR